MKHLNNYKIFENKEDIDSICRKYYIKNYTINDDGSIDVDGYIDLTHNRLSKLPLKFNRVTDGFYIQNNNITSLEGSPKYVGDNFVCFNNKITSFEGSPKYVGGDFSCSSNKITSLEGYPEHVGVGRSFYCEYNPVYSIVKYFLFGKNRNNLIELFNYYDIVQDMNVIYDRLKYFYDGIDNIKVTDRMLKDIENNGYKIIY